MTKTITAPWRLQMGTKFRDAIPLLNDNFEKVGGTFQGFAVEGQLAFPYNATTLNIPANGLRVFAASAIATAQGNQLIIVYPRLSVYIDAPVLGASDTEYNVDYLFPVGSALSTAQKALLISNYNGISRVASASSFVSTYDGQTYYGVRDVVYTIRNADSSAHTYNFVFGQSVYTAGTSFYR